jgi:hypothetical protein
MPIVSKAEIVVALGKADKSLSDGDSALINMIWAPTEKLVENFVGGKRQKLSVTQFTEYLPTNNLLPQPDVLIDNYEKVGNQVVPWFRDSYWDRRRLPLQYVPVRYPIISVFENLNAYLPLPPGAIATEPGYWPPSTQLQERQDYYLDMNGPTLSHTGFVIRNIGTWQWMERCIKITYNAGYTQDELSGTFPHVRLATLQAIVIKFNELKQHQPDVVSRGGGVGAIQSEGLDGWTVAYGKSTSDNFGMVTDLPASVKRMLAKDVGYSQYL